MKGLEPQWGPTQPDETDVAGERFAPGRSGRIPERSRVQPKYPHGMNGTTRGVLRRGMFNSGGRVARRTALVTGIVLMFLTAGVLPAATAAAWPPPPDPCDRVNPPATCAAAGTPMGQLNQVARVPAGVRVSG